MLFSHSHPLIWVPVVIVRGTHTRTCPLSEHMQTYARVGIALIASVCVCSIAQYATVSTTHRVETACSLYLLSGNSLVKPLQIITEVRRDETTETPHDWRHEQG